MRKIHLLAHISLDGFVADSNGSLDNFPGGQENLSFVNELTKQADATLMGRISYELLHQYWPSQEHEPSARDAEKYYSAWYNRARKYIVSTKIDTAGDQLTTIIKEDIAEKIKTLKQQPGAAILVFGSPTLFQYLETHNLVDDYWIFVNPVTFGNGIPLFSPSASVRKLRLESTHQFPNGELVMHYTPII